MRLLLDTHALLWFCEGNPALSATARAAMEDSTNERYVSHATPWEVAIKVSLGRLDLQVGFDAQRKRLLPLFFKSKGQSPRRDPTMVTLLDATPGAASR